MFPKEQGPDPVSHICRMYARTVCLGHAAASASISHVSASCVYLFICEEEGGKKLFGRKAVASDVIQIKSGKLRNERPTVYI